MAPAVFTACAAAKLWPLLVPARMTWLLQPLDTHVLSLFKAALQQAFQAARIRAADGRVDLSDLLTSVYAATQLVLEGRSWAHAFDSDGFVQAQSRVSTRVKDALRLSGAVHVAPTRPSTEELRVCFPRNVRVPVAHVWKAVSGSGAAGSVSATAPLRRSPRLAAASARVAAARGASAASVGASSSAAPSGMLTRARARPEGLGSVGMCHSPTMRPSLRLQLCEASAPVRK